MTTPTSFDPIWEDGIYGRGRQLNRYPFDSVVAFVTRSRHSTAEPIRVVEVGCGAGNNVWFLAREGCLAAGIDASPTAIDTARDRLRSDGLVADLRVGDFSRLPWSDASFDLAIDRAAITHTNRSSAAIAISELHRVLRPGGLLFFNPFASDHTSATSGRRGEDGVRVGISEGTLQGVGQVSFYDVDALENLFRSGWRIVNREHVTVVSDDGSRQCEWRVIAERLAPPQRRPDRGTA